MELKLKRVSYGKPSTPAEDREYRIDGMGPVGTVKEYQKHFPKATLLIFEGNKQTDTITSGDMISKLEDFEKAAKELQETWEHIVYPTHSEDYPALTPEQLDLIFDGDGQWVNTRFVKVAKHEQEKEQFV